MNRRDFSSHSLQLAAAGLLGTGLALPLTASAQGAAIEGKEYQKISRPVPVALGGATKIEVVEFFWYGCPHCNALQPQLEAWVKRLPADVAFRPVPVGFAPQHEYHQKLFYALEAMGQLGAMHDKVFAAIHVARKRMDKDAEVAEFISANGLDGAKLVETMKSFSVSGKSRQAKQLTEAYHIDGVPTLGIQGRYTTSASMTGSPERAFAVAEQLMAQIRKTGA
jgi:thiol:disulfide interchange protein DsbA